MEVVFEVLLLVNLDRRSLAGDKYKMNRIISNKYSNYT